MHLIIYGPEGSGKGTQAEQLSKHLGLPIYNSGNLVRQKAKENNSKVGEICRNALTEGKYVDNQIMFLLWKEYLSSAKAKKGFILDGFPRNEKQAIFLFENVKKLGYNIDGVIFININDEISFQRLIIRKRKIFEGSNISHDTPIRIKKRLKEYRKEEKKLLLQYKKNSNLIEIDGNQKKEKVFMDILKEINSIST
jgi:adenylate kinase